MNAAIVDGDLSFPLNSGKRLRTMHLLTRMAQRKHRITYICRGEALGTDAQQITRFLAERGIETIVVDDPVPRKAGWQFYGRLAANLASPLPYAVASHDSPKMREQVQALASRRRVDLWQFEWTPYADMLPWSPRVRKLINAHNVDSLLWERYYRTEANAARRWYIKQQWRKFEAYERAALPRAARVVTVSEEDATLVRERFEMARVDVVDNGIDKDFFADVKPCGRLQRILFLGSLDWRPNLDAVGILLDLVLPAVRKELPAAQFCIVGRNPPAWLLRRTRDLPGVELHPNAADIRPYLSQSAVMAVPLRSGGGSRLKILEALASGLPVVSTRVGAEGLCLRHGQELIIVERAEEVSAELVRCLRDPAGARAMAERGRQFVLQNYDWDVLAGKLEKAWEKCV
jgi:polysaccharide biosynthesis protein PslH